MSVMEFVFIFFGVQIIGSSLVILFTRNVVYAATALLSTLLGVAALFVIAGSDLLAVVQLVVYAGGVLILLLFGVLYTYRAPETYYEKRNSVISILSVVVISGLLMFLLSDLAFNFPELHRPPTDRLGITRLTGYLWITNNIIVFEVVALFLLVILVGAGWIASRVMDLNKKEL
jgi:NADH-quinone oxidoreductase subunit J